MIIFKRPTEEKEIRKYVKEVRNHEHRKENKQEKPENVKRMRKQKIKQTWKLKQRRYKI